MHGCSTVVENGNSGARIALADFLTTMYFGTKSEDSCAADNNVTVDPYTLFITSGVSHGIQLACRTLKRLHEQGKLDDDMKDSMVTNNDPPLCLIEDPTYFLVPPIFQQAGFELQAVATHPARGLSVKALKATLQRIRETSPGRLVVLYSIPVHHNPLGVSLNEQDRHELANLCETYKVYLIADEVYHGLSFPSPPTEAAGTEQDSATVLPSSSPPFVVKPMAAIMKSPFVISVSAFTKILCPGIRCGWIHAAANVDFIQQIGRDGVLDSGGCSSQLSSGIATQLIESQTLLPYMSLLQSEYAKRCHHLCRLLQQEASTNSNNNKFGFEFQIPEGGYFVWVKVTGVEFPMDDKFRLFCRNEYHVDFRTGTSCSSDTWQPTKAPPPPSPQHQQYIRLCFAYYDTPALSQGVERLCKAIQAYSTKQAQQRPSAL